MENSFATSSLQDDIEELSRLKNKYVEKYQAVLQKMKDKLGSPISEI